MPDTALLAIPLLVLGFACLLFGGDMLVAGASALARRMGLSELVVGLTVVAFGTSMPEMVVSVTASAGGENAISIGNVVGSNICNIALILGVCALIRPVLAAHGTVWKEIPFLLVASVVFTIMASDTLFGQDETVALLSRGDGLILLVFFALFLYYIVRVIRAGAPEAAPDPGAPSPIATPGALLRTGGGLLLLLVGGQVVVSNAVNLAGALGVSDRVIGLTIVAIGTSLPELAASAMAAYRGNAGIALGNIVGSNIFNTLLILGVSATVAPLPFPPGSNADAAVMLGFTALLFAMAFTGRLPYQIQRLEGVVLLAGYGAYLAWLLLAR